MKDKRKEERTENEEKKGERKGHCFLCDSEVAANGK